MTPEGAILTAVWLRKSRSGVVLFRNNVGKLQDRNGRWVTYGLHVGSADLIGWTPTVITPDMVGKTVAVFTSVEVKTPAGKVRPEQERWRETVSKAGGNATFERA